MDSYALARRNIWTDPNLASGEKSALSRVFDRLGGGGSAAFGRVTAAVGETSKVVREGAEALVVGAAIGTIRAKLGTDLTTASFWKNADGTPVVSVPVEAVVAAAGYGYALMEPSSEVAPTARRAANVAVAIYAAKKAEAYFSGMPTAPAPSSTVAPPGEFGIDHITAAANALGRSGR